MSRRRPHEEDDGYDRAYRKRRRVSENQEIEDRLESLILRVGEKSTSSLESNLEGLASVLEADLSTFRNKILRILTDCATKMPEKCTIYTTLVGLLNVKNYNFGGEFVEYMVRNFKESLKGCRWDSARYSLRFLADLVNCHVIAAGSLVQLLTNMVEASLEDGVPQVRKDWYVYAVLCTLPWIGRELYEKKEQALENLLVTIQVFLGKRQKKHLPALRVWSNDNPHPQEEYLDCLWAQICKLRQDNWQEKHIPRPYIAFDSVLSEALQHNLPAILPPPHHESYIYPMPSVVFRMFDYTDCPEGPILPGAHSIERFLIEEHLHQIIEMHHLERKECAAHLLNFPYKNKIPLDYCIVEVIFGELFHMPNPRYLEICYGSILIELCKLQPSTMPQVLAQATEILFMRIDTMNTSCFDRLVSWFAYHLSNFQFRWSWEDWSECLALEGDHPKPKFVQETLQKALRLSYYQRIREMVSEPFENLLPPKPEIFYKYASDDPNSLPGSSVAVQLMAKIRSKCSPEEVIAILKELPNPAMDDDAGDSRFHPLKIDVFVQTLLYLGSKSFSHSFAAISKFHYIFKILAESEEAQICILRNLYEIWHHHPQMICVLIEKMLKTQIIECSAVANWIFSKEMSSDFTRLYLWEILHLTIKKMNKHVSRVSRELSDARERLGRGDTDSESDNENKNSDEKEKPTEEMVDRMEERLEAAQADQKNLFLIIFQFPKELNESESDLKKNTQKSNANIETKTLEENNGIVLEEGDISDRVIEPNTTALIPPWIRNSLGLSEKGSRSNHRCLKTLRTSGDRLVVGEIGEMKSDPDDACIKTNFCLETSSSNGAVEVNIGNEADFSEEPSDPEGKSSSAWNSKTNKHNQYDCNIFGVYKDNRITRPELTSIDIVVPKEEQEEEKRKVRVHKTRSKAHKKSFAGGLKNEPDISSKSSTRQFGQKTDSGVSNTNGVKQVDARILLLCGKNTIDNLKEDDVSLIEDMKNQIGHKEGFEKLFSEIKETAFQCKSLNKEIIEGKRERVEKRDEKEIGEMVKKERGKVFAKTEFDGSPDVNGLTPKTDENDLKMINNILTKSKAMEEERKYMEEIRRHYEKKKVSQHRLVKYPEEVEMEKDGKKMEKCRMFPQRMSVDKDKKSKWRHNDLSVVEKTVSEILHKFIKFYRFQVPPDIVTSMKKNIIQTLQSEYPETGLKKNLDVIFAVQEQLKNTENDKGSMDSLLMEEREDKSIDIIARQKDQAACKESDINPEENVVSKDVPMDNKYTKSPFRTLLANVKETKSTKDGDMGHEQNFKDLKNDFEMCLKSIQTQLDITGTKLCSVILEKGEVQDVSNQKLRIFHDLSTGMTDFIKLCSEKVHAGSPEGDNTSVKVCHCNATIPVKTNCNQFSQTQEKEMTKNGTQTDCTDPSNTTDLASGVYRIIKTADLGSFYVYPEVIDDVVEVKTTVSEPCELPGNDVFDIYRDDVLKSVSRETFISEKIPSVNIGQKLRRAFKSDCLGLNKIELEELTRPESKISILNVLGENVASEKQELPALMADGEESVLKRDTNSGNQELLKPESYHVGCVWFWNGKKMDPGVDLKVHVEDLLREKLREILNEVRVKEDPKSCESGEDKEKSALVVDAGTNITQDRSLEKNLEIRKTHGKFCVTNSNHLETDITPFIFSGSNKQEQNLNIQIPTEDKALQRLDIDNFVKSVREVGTQNSQHTFVSLNITKLKPRSKVCTVAKFSQQRPRKHISPQKLPPERPFTSAEALSFAENVGEAKKVKLEVRESDGICSSNDKCSNGGNLRECYSLMSNESSSSSDGPVRVKLIGIEVSKEKKVSEEGEFYESSGKETKKLSSDEERRTLRELPKKFKHWELIENVLNRVNQKEKDTLWNDIRDFVKKKIGRDINDEGAREVCIEIEQDVPKFFKGKPSQAVVAKGNYTRNEGDVEVEVDLTLDDLERILRHRQRKLRRRNNYHKMKTDSKNSFSSSGTSSDGTRNYTSNCSAFGGNDYTNCSEIKMSKNEN